MDSISNMTLADASPGESVVLGRPSAPTREVLRLMEMGLVPGADVVVTRRAPFGDPLEVITGTTRLCVRKDDAARFPVERP
jgi:Fe2+ transport system protein FeoA